MFPGNPDATKPHDEPTPDIGPPPRALGHAVGFLLQRAQRQAHEIAAREMTPDSHPRDYALLSAIAGLNTVSQQELAQRLHINRTLMVKLIDKLEAQGWVARERDPADRRRYALVVTPEGHRHCAAIEGSVARAEDALGAPLTPHERDRLRTLLQAVLRDHLAEDLPPRLTDRLGFLIVRAFDINRQNADAHLADLGIAARHFGALTAIGEAEPCTQQEVASRLGVSGTLVVQFTDKLEADGLVERVRNPADRRSYALHLTPRGREVHAEAWRRLLDPAGGMVLLDPAADRELAQLLRKLIGLDAEG